MNNLVQCLTTLTVRFFFSLCSIGISLVASCAFCPSHSVFPSTSQTPGHTFSIILLQAVENSSYSLLVFSKQRSHTRPTSNVTCCSTLITSAAALRWTLSSLWASLILEGPELETVFWVQLQRCWVEGNNRFPWPAGLHTPAEAARCVVSLDHCKGALLTHTQPTDSQKSCCYLQRL